MHRKPHPLRVWREPMATRRAPLKDVTSSSAVVWLPCFSAWLTVSTAPLVFVCVSRRLNTFHDWRNWRRNCLIDFVWRGKDRFGECRDMFFRDSRETAGCLYLLPGLKLLWCNRLANKLTKCFQKLASFLAFQLAKSDGEIRCVGIQSSDNDIFIFRYIKSKNCGNVSNWLC